MRVASGCGPRHALPHLRLGEESRSETALGDPLSRASGGRAGRQPLAAVVREGDVGVLPASGCRGCRSKASWCSREPRRPGPRVRLGRSAGASEPGPLHRTSFTGAFAAGSGRVRTLAGGAAVPSMQAHHALTQVGGNLVAAAVRGDQLLEVPPELGPLHARVAVAQMAVDVRRSSRPSPRRGSARSRAASRDIQASSTSPSFLGRVPQRLLQRFSSPMQPAHHGSDRNVHDLGDLLVGETLDVGQQHGHAELLGQRLERLLHVRRRGSCRAPRSRRVRLHGCSGRRAGGTGRSPRRRRGSTSRGRCFLPVRVDEACS